MLSVIIPGGERFDETTEEFIYIKTCTLQLEHSLVSLSRWESKWHKPFLGKTEKTKEETLDYIRCMTVTPNVDPNVYSFLTQDLVDKISAYIHDSMTATTFPKDSGGKTSREQITSELIYYWMVSFGIPFECEKWHLNRLITLITICGIKNKPSKKMSKRDVCAQNRALNTARMNRGGL